MRRRHGSIPTNSAEAAVDFRADYNAAKASRFKKRRTGLGGSGDSHYATDQMFFDIIEEIRDMERNEWVVGRLLDLAVQNEILTGPTIDPDTGNPDLNELLKAGFNAWGADRFKCCDQHRFTFDQQTRLVSRSVKRDGDILANLTEDRTIELLEADRLRTPSYSRKNRERIVHGVELDNRRRAVRYWVTTDPGMTRNFKLADMTPLDPFDDMGDPVILHIAHPNRVTQTRGVSPFARLFDRVGMGDDLEFANLVKHQMASAFGLFIKQDPTALATMGPQAVGSSETTTREDGTSQTTEQLGVGTIGRLGPGESIENWGPNIPADNFFPHMRLILQEVGASLGLPLVMLLMDASETNFSGYRGAVEQSRQHARENRIVVIEAKWLRPVYHWWVRGEVANNPRVRELSRLAGVNVFGHRWRWPGWKYIQPRDDAEADGLRRDNLTPMRIIAGDLGYDIDDFRADHIADNRAYIVAALEAAAEINKKNKDAGVTWRDVLFMRPDPKSALAQNQPADASRGGGVNA